MNALVVLSMLVAAASAGYVGDHYGGALGYGGLGYSGLGGYSGYSGYGTYGTYGGYGHGSALGYAHAPVAYTAPVIKTIAPVATSYQNQYQISKSAYPVHYSTPAIVKTPVVAAPLAYAAPAYGHGYGYGAGLGYGSYGLGHDLGYGHY